LDFGGGGDEFDRVLPEAATDCALFDKVYRRDIGVVFEKLIFVYLLG
jgi:hypothetical protein